MDNSIINDKRDGPQKDRRTMPNRRFVIERRIEPKVNLMNINIAWIRLFLSARDHENADVIIKFRDSIPQVGEVLPLKRERKYYT